MIRLLQAGLLAGAGHLISILILTLLVSRTPVATAYLVYAYVVMAVGFFLSARRSVDIAAKRIRGVSSAMRDEKLRQALVRLASQLVLSAILCVILSLRVHQILHLS